MLKCEIPNDWKVVFSEIKYRATRYSSVFSVGVCHAPDTGGGPPRRSTSYVAGASRGERGLFPSSVQPIAP